MNVPKIKSNRIAEIKARLAAATPGPWTANLQGNYVDVQTERDKRLEQRRGWRHYLLEINLHFDFREKEYSQASANAEFVANAPADIAYLLAEVKRLKKENSNGVKL
jgi:hypothetical protein